MNSDESDWDSMSEAPPHPAQQQGSVINPPPQDNQHKHRKHQAASAAAPPSTAPTAPTPKPRPPSSLPPPELKTDFRQKALAMEQEKIKEEETKQVKVKSEKKEKPCKKVTADHEVHLSDLTASPPYEDSGLGSSPEKEQVSGGLDNPSYQGDKDSGAEGERSTKATRPARLPEPEERICLLPFDDMRTRYLQVELEDEGLLVDRILPPIVHCCDRGAAEILGVAKIPAILLFIFLGQVRFLSILSFCL